MNELEERAEEAGDAMARSAKITRRTLETGIEANLDLEGTGIHEVATGIAMLDHLISSFVFHSGFDLRLAASCRGFESRHHLVEDAGIVLGEALRQAYGNGCGAARFGSASVPMDDALVLAAVDMGGRGYFRWDLPVEDKVTDGFECRLAGEFFRAFSANARLALHLKYIWGSDPHHLLEACFKAAALSVREATGIRCGRQGSPSTKGAI